MLKRSWIVIFALCTGALFAQQGATIRKIPASRTPPEDARAMFKAYCASCHGADGKGGGPASAALKTPTPDLTTLAKRNKGKFPELRVYGAIDGGVRMAAHGSPEMPVWGEVFGGGQGESKLRVRNLTKYVESLQVR